MTLDLFGDAPPPSWNEALADGALVLRGFAAPQAGALLDAIAAITAISPLRHMTTRGGYVMSVAMSNCGRLGWVTDETGYRYATVDPLTARPWPAMPAWFARLARQAAQAAGFADFAPDACLINRYDVGTRLSLHQDKNERDYRQPIVSVSLGLPAVFLFGGMHRNDPARRVALTHGDVVVWGGESRLRYHGILPLKAGAHAFRFNLTFRKAG